MAFLDEAGLAYFYSLIEAKLALAGSSKYGSVEVTKGSYVGGGDGTWPDGGMSISISPVSGSRPLLDGQCNALMITSAKSAMIVFQPSSIGSGFSMYKDDDEDIVTVSFISGAQMAITNGSGKISLSIANKPAGFTPYDPAFSSLVPDYAKATMNESGVIYEVIALRLSSGSLQT